LAGSAPHDIASDVRAARGSIAPPASAARRRTLDVLVYLRTMLAFLVVWALASAWKSNPTTSIACR